MVGAATLNARSAVTVLVLGTSRVTPSPDLIVRRGRHELDHTDTEEPTSGDN